MLITKHGPVTSLAKLHECMNSGVRAIYEYAALHAGSGIRTNVRSVKTFIARLYVGWLISPRVILINEN